MSREQVGSGSGSGVGTRVHFLVRGPVDCPAGLRPLRVEPSFLSLSFSLSLPPSLPPSLPLSLFSPVLSCLCPSLSPSLPLFFSPVLSCLCPIIFFNITASRMVMYRCMSTVCYWWSLDEVNGQQLQVLGVLCADHQCYYEDKYWSVSLSVVFLCISIIIIIIYYLHLYLYVISYYWKIDSCCYWRALL